MKIEEPDLERVSVLLGVDDQNRILLQHRDSHAPIKPNIWGFFGGHMEEGEWPEEALRREIREELQIDLGDMMFFQSRIFEESWGRIERNFFVAQIDHSPDVLRAQQQEGDDLGFFTEEEIKDLEMIDNDREMIHGFFRWVNLRIHAQLHN